MHNEVWFYCDVLFVDNVRYEFRCDTFNTCMDRVNLLVEKHGSFVHLSINKQEA